MLPILIIVASIVVSIWMIYTVLSLAPWFPTRRSDVERIDKLANLQVGDQFYDIGSGDGRVVFPLAKKYPECSFYGYEMSFWLFLYSWMILKSKAYKNVSLKLVNGLQQDYSKASVVYVFATQKTLNDKPMENVIAQLPSGARILSYNFHLEKWSGEKSKDKPKGKTPIYKYIKT